jgi:hypothetical protein
VKIKDVELLLDSHRELVALALKYASECSECDGTGLVSIKTFPGGIEVDNDDQPCAECADIRAEIDKATQVRTAIARPLP